MLVVDDDVVGTRTVVKRLATSSRGHMTAKVPSAEGTRMDAPARLYRSLRLSDGGVVLAVVPPTDHDDADEGHGEPTRWSSDRPARALPTRRHSNPCCQAVVEYSLPVMGDPRDLDQFLTQWVDGYLLGDLASMVADPPSPNRGVGYPILITALAGMELLGRLLWPSTKYLPKREHRGNQFFLNYWDNYFVAENGQYRGLGDMFRQLVRHGIAHAFLAKGSVIVWRGTGRPTCLDPEANVLYVDCVVFEQEFVRSYRQRVMPILAGTDTHGLTSRDGMQERLIQLLDDDDEQVAKYFPATQALDPAMICGASSDISAPPSALTGGTGGIGPTGATGPVDQRGSSGPTGATGMAQ